MSQNVSVQMKYIYLMLSSSYTWFYSTTITRGEGCTYGYIWYIYMFCVDVFGEYIKFLSHLVQCNYEVCMLASCWEMRVLCPENRVKGRKIGFVQAVFCNSKLTLQLSLAPDCSTEYFLEVAGKARQSWVLHKTFAAAAGGEIISIKNNLSTLKLICPN